jgi:sigma-B regulation protein RsbU (phosphoserine phosphatase)
MITGRQTVDDCLWIDNLDGQKLDSGTYIVQVIPGGVADIAGIKNGDILLKINGKGFKNSNEAQAILNDYNKETVTYTVLRDGAVYNFSVWVFEFFNPLYLIFALLAYFFLFIGFLVGYSKPKEYTSQLFFFLGCTAMGLMIFSNLNFGFQAGILVFYNYSVALLFFAPLFLHFCLTYPIKYDFRRRKALLTWTYTFSILLQSGLFIILIFQIPVDFNFFTIRFIFTNLCFLTGITVFVRSYMRLNDEMLKRSLNIILKGFVIGAIGFIYYFTIVSVITSPVFLVNPLVFVPAILVLSIPVSLGYSIFKYRILDTEFIVKRGLVFGIITGFIIAIYLFLVFVLNSVLSTHFEEDKQLLTILTIVIITFSFDYVNRKAKGFVDKQFYRERYNYRKSLLLFSQELPYLSNINEILKRIASSVNETMRVRNINIWIMDEQYSVLVNKDHSKHFSNAKENHTLYDKAFSELFRKSKEPRLLYEVNLTELKIEDKYKDVFRSERIVLSIPIFLKDKLIGAINFGNKPSGKAYSDEDIDLLKTLASQSAIAFENARLHKEEISKQKIEEELKIARKIQNSLLPEEAVVVEGLDISWVSKPAKMIGGDFYDLIRIDEKRILIVVADVSGKGIPAALYMSQVQAMIQFAAGIFKTPREILTEVNKLVHEKIDKRSFITMIAALFDTENNKVKIARAGHNPAIMSLNGKVEILKNKGMGLGLESEKLFDINLEESEFTLNPDNLFVFYSDGLTEAMNAKREEFSTERTMEIVTRHRYSEPSVILNNLMSSVKDFTGTAEQNDDITLVVVKTK